MDAPFHLQPLVFFQTISLDVIPCKGNCCQDLEATSPALSQDVQHLGNLLQMALHCCTFSLKQLLLLNGLSSGFLHCNYQRNRPVGKRDHYRNELQHHYNEVHSWSMIFFFQAELVCIIKSLWRLSLMITELPEVFLVSSQALFLRPFLCKEQCLSLVILNQMFSVMQRHRYACTLVGPRDAERAYLSLLSLLLPSYLHRPKQPLPGRQPSRVSQGGVQGVK